MTALRGPSNGSGPRTVRSVPVIGTSRCKTPDRGLQIVNDREKTHSAGVRLRRYPRVAAPESDTLGLAWRGDCCAAAR